jgi:hypothetical protein
VVSFTSRPLYLQGKSPWYPSGRRLGWSQSRSGRGGEEKVYFNVHSRIRYASMKLISYVLTLVY